jgi:hypothetical protein
MILRQKFDELKKEKIFKIGEGDRLFLVFCIVDDSCNIQQIDFSFEHRKAKGNGIAIKCFSLQKGKWIFEKSADSREFKDLTELQKNNFEGIKDIADVVTLLAKMLKADGIEKYIFTLQNEDEGVVYNVTCLSKDFRIRKIMFDARDLSVIKQSDYNLFDFFSIR